jgi:hypothetical protein
LSKKEERSVNLFAKIQRKRIMVKGGNVETKRDPLEIEEGEETTRASTS